MVSEAKNGHEVMVELRTATGLSSHDMRGAWEAVGRWLRARVIGRGRQF